MKRIFLISVLLFFVSSSAFAKDSADIIVVLDQSGSITGNLPVVKEYVKMSIFKKVAKEDDTVYVFSFDGLFHPIRTMKGNATDAEIDSCLAEINPVGYFTDLTNAVEGMRLYVQQNCDPKKKKVVFFLTDGINDPPSFSPYKEGLQHRFFTESKKEVIDNKWQVFVTGIGEKTDAANVANLVGADYVELSSKPTLSEFDQKLTGRLKEARSGFWKWFFIIGGTSLAALGGGAYFFIVRR